LNFPKLRLAYKLLISFILEFDDFIVGNYLFLTD